MGLRLESPGGYLDRLIRVMGALDQSALESFFWLLGSTVQRGSRLWIAGNGGSATNANHFATDLLRCQDFGLLPRASSLSSNEGVLTAIANDHGPTEMFSRQLTILAEPNDLLVTLSASGSSPNIIRALEWAKANGVVSLALTGFDGGLARGMADFAVHVPTQTGDYGIVEDTHLAICHAAVDSLLAGAPPRERVD